jgi:molybdopterin/thiamine biosynthesis adenylyltransferase
MLTDAEKQRYDRQMMVRGIGEEGQEKLKNARVVIAGTGGLGTPSALYLAAAGVGTIRIIDSDRVELSNLNRQILHWNKDIGRNKIDSAGEKLREINDTIQIEAIAETIDEGSVARLTSGFDVILDGTDNLETRFLLNSAALANGIPFVHGAVYGFEGRVTTVVPGKTPCLGCIYRGTIPQQKSPVVGVTPGLVGILQATETIKYIVGVGTLLTNQLLVYNGLRMRFNTLAIKRDPNCKYCRGIGQQNASSVGPDPAV